MHITEGPDSIELTKNNEGLKDTFLVMKIDGGHISHALKYLFSILR